MSEIEISESHWDACHDRQRFIAGWEKKLRAAIAEHPAPAKRFEDWLTRRAAGESGLPGVKLIFIEQPYLGWAQLVERVADQTDKECRERIADEILNPGCC